MIDRIQRPIRITKRIGFLAYDSYAVHLTLLGWAILLIFPTEWRITQAAAVGSWVLSNERLIRRLPHLFTEAEIPEWYKWIVTFYWVIVGVYYLTADVVAYADFVLNIWPIVAIPITLLSSVAILQVEGFQSEPYDVP